uniref:Nuclear receptor domain-containing protein n=1 Tax=Caenorhabditis tropicalis TaxID=1561998 RepID=A0A1I7TI80_9PELO
MSLTYTASLCVVCQKEAHGYHFGVLTCRACAMFFSRSRFRKEDYTCQKSSTCKHCRLRRCEEVGMGTGEVRRVSYSVIDPITKRKTDWIHIDTLISRAKKVLEEFQAPPTSLNPLQQLTGALKKLRSGQSFQPKFEESMAFDDYFSHWKKFMVRAAEWMMHMNQFGELPIQERISIFKITWAVWRRFERHSMSSVVFGKRCCDEKLLLVSDDVATRITDFQVDYSDLTIGNGFDWFRSSVRLNLLRLFDTVSRPCLYLSDTEVAFALTHIVWRYASRKLLGQTLQAADSILAEISENLHDYYQNELKDRELCS